MHMKGKTAASTTTQLYEAVIKGDLHSFRDLLREDPLIIDRCVIENSLGGFNQSPLHVAVHMGHLEIVKTLLTIHPRMCLAHDHNGRNPIHVAAIHGRSNLLELLHEANPHAAKERMSNGETILHLCVKHNQLNALKILLKLTNSDGDQLLNYTDNNGNTVLHLAVAGKQSEMVEYLLAQPKIKKNTINKNGMAAVDIHKKQKKNRSENKKTEQSLMKAKAKTAKEEQNQKARGTWYEEQRTTLMVVASLIATMAFQVGMNPPGGVWQDNSEQKNNPSAASPPNPEDYHRAGYAIWSYSKHDDFQYFGFNVILICNTLALLSSLSVVLLLISGFRCKRFFLSILRITLWIAVTTTTLTYGFAIGSLAQNVIPMFLKVMVGCIFGWLGLIFTLVFGNVVRIILRFLDWKRKESIKDLFKKLLGRSRHSTAAVTNDPHNFESPYQL